MRVKFSQIAAFVALALALVVGIAFAQDASTGKPMHRGMHGAWAMGGGGMGLPLHQLNLTDEQHAQIKQIMQAEKPNMKPLMQQEFQAHQQMMQLISSGTFDQAKANALATQEAQIHAQMEVEHMKITSQIYNLLDSTQKAKVADMMAKHQARMQQHMQNNAAPSEQQ